jgi:hypothetical protein
MPTTSTPPKFQIQSSESPAEIVSKYAAAAHNLASSSLTKLGFSSDQISRIINSAAFPESSLSRAKTTIGTKIDETVISALVLQSLRDMLNAFRKSDTYAAATAAFIAGGYYEKLKAAQVQSVQIKGGKSLSAKRRLARDLRNAEAAKLLARNPKLSLKELHGKVNVREYKVSCAQFRTDFKIYKNQQAEKETQDQKSLEWVNKFVLSGALGRK